MHVISNNYTCVHHFWHLHVQAQVSWYNNNYNIIIAIRPLFVVNVFLVTSELT